MDTNTITFNTLPTAVAQLTNEVSEIKRLLLQQSNEPAPTADELLTVSDTAKFLRLSVPTIYNLIHKGEIPMMKRAKRCYFTREDLLNYLKEGKRKSNAEIQSEARTNLITKNGGKL